MDIKRNIRLFFVSYGKLLFEILFVVALIIFGLQYLNKKVAEPKQVSAQINIENNNVNKSNIQDANKNKKDISMFIEYCKNNEIQEAYEMLADECKYEKYNSIDLFNKEYVQKLFNFDIEKYEVYIKDKKYIVELKESAISSGREESIKELKFDIKKGMLENKIYVYD